jgi:methyltransferase family protein
MSDIRSVWSRLLYKTANMAEDSPNLHPVRQSMPVAQKMYPRRRQRALNLLATWFPNSRFVGIDLSEEAIKFARVEAEQRGNKNVSFIARDLSHFDQQAQPGTFDFITTFEAKDQPSASPSALPTGKSV